MNKEVKILCVFTDNTNMINHLNSMISLYKQDINSDIFLYCDKTDNNRLFLTVTIENNTKNKLINNSILLHRKKITNTLFTVNALNEVIKIENNGITDDKYEVDWNKYKNQILLSNEIGLIKTHIQFIGKLNLTNIKQINPIS